MSLSQDKVLEKLAQKAEECHHLSPKKARTFAVEALALQQNLLLRRKQKQSKSVSKTIK